MECSVRSVLEVSRIFSNIPQTLNNIEITVDYMLEITDGYHRHFIERRVAPRIADINDHMQALRIICEKMKSELDSILEQNVQKENQLKTKMNSLRLQIDVKRIEMKKLRDEKERTEASLNNAETQLENAKKALSEAEKKLEKAKDAQLGVGLGGTPLLVAAPFTLLIPIVGPLVAAGTAIAGSSMIIASVTVLQDNINDKRSVVSSARDNRSIFEKSLNDINQKLRNLQSDIENSFATERRLKRETDCLSSSIENIKRMQRKMSEFLQMFNTGFHQLTEASGRSRVLYSSSVYAYNLKHLKPLVEAFCESFLLFAETELFDSLNVYRHIDLDQIRRIGNKAKTIQNARTSQLTYNEFDDCV